ncbi:hypothetical protein [Mycoplasmopsis agalactiae]|uniref:hypothetical protein n=1 Tax=Mycoplasmopsis agalactiae TaxID=2110 RepID=UPI001F408F84|nr:hypothetical protein [Mycoplasmopsis agalactiae]
MNHINIFALGGLDENGKKLLHFGNIWWKRRKQKIYVINSGAKVPINSSNKIDTLIPNFNYLIKTRMLYKAFLLLMLKMIHLVHFHDY